RRLDHAGLVGGAARDGLAPAGRIEADIEIDSLVRNGGGTHASWLRDVESVEVEVVARGDVQCGRAREGQRDRDGAILRACVAAACAVVLRERGFDAQLISAVSAISFG